jgi:hypothetical protein
MLDEDKSYASAMYAVNTPVLFGEMRNWDPGREISLLRCLGAITADAHFVNIRTNTVT